MSGLTKEEKLAKRLANKRPTTTTKPLQWRTIYGGGLMSRGPAASLKVRKYRGKSGRRQFIKERREDKQCADCS